MTEEQLDAWLRVLALEFNPRRMLALLQHHDCDAVALWRTPGPDWRALDSAITPAQLDRIAEVRSRDLRRERQLLDKFDAWILTRSDPRYPANLRQIPDSPPALIVRGDLAPEDKFSVAIVGSRRASAYGLSIARRFAGDLAGRGLTVVSGGARGVDTQAHRGTLDARGRTIAFLGSGVDVAYPADNRKLFEEIAAGGGAVLSEFIMGTRPEPWRFPARNRLISGMSLGTLVIESPSDSGSLITARVAGEQGREVFAIPGPIDTGKSAGCHKLIQDGAKLVQSVEDVLDELGVLTMRSPDSARPSPSLGLGAPAPGDLPPEQRRILDMLNLQPRHVDEMIGESGLTAPQVTGILTLLEMRGLARRVPGNAFVRVL